MDIQSLYDSIKPQIRFIDCHKILECRKDNCTDPPAYIGRVIFVGVSQYFKFDHRRVCEFLQIPLTTYQRFAEMYFKAFERRAKTAFDTAVVWKTRLTVNWIKLHHPETAITYSELVEKIKFMIPVGSYIEITAPVLERTTNSGIVLMNPVKSHTEATVLAVGKDVEEVAAGDRIMYSTGREVCKNDKYYVTIDSVACVLSK